MRLHCQADDWNCKQHSLDHFPLFGHSLWMSENRIKNLDHLVLPVPTLDAARTRLAALGFTVAPDGHHPFGTENACVFFQDDTYLEPLAIGNKAVYEREAEKGNGFLRRDRLFRQRNGDDGLSLIALTTEDAAADREVYLKAGYDCGKMVAFRRDVKQPDGSKREIAINLFITTIDNASDLALFSCQWLSDKVFDDEHKIHANGALGIAAVVLADNNDDPSDAYLKTLTGQGGFEPCAEGPEFGKSLALENASLKLLTPAGFEHDYNLDTRNLAQGLRALAFDVIVNDLANIQVVLRISGIKSTRIGSRLVVPPATGQGYTLAFMQQNGS